MEQLRHENVEFLKGGVQRSPVHWGPPETETAVIFAPLLHLCSLESVKVVTTQSQPSGCWRGSCYGNQGRRDQRNFVEGFLLAPTAKTTDSAFVGKWLNVLADELDRLPSIEYGIYNRPNGTSYAYRECIANRTPSTGAWNGQGDDRRMQYVTIEGSCAPPRCSPEHTCTDTLTSLSWQKDTRSPASRGDEHDAVTMEWRLYTNGLMTNEPFRNFENALATVKAYDHATYSPSEDPRIISFFVCDANFNMPPGYCIQQFIEALVSAKADRRLY